MAEYISKQAFKEKYLCCGWLPEMSEEEFNSFPAADVVEMRHGRWGEYESFPLTPSLNGHPCSECGMRFPTSAIPVMKYCPNCGARMDKENEHEAG